MAWSKPRYSKSQVDRAGNVARMVLADKEISEADEGYLDIISNWRAAHSYPLHNFHRLVKRHAERCEENSIVAHRQKRIESILDKLLRLQSLKLSQMQDIAGVRAVMSSLDCVRQVAAGLRDAEIAHTLYGEKDYIAAPKEDGYRGVHLMYRYEGVGRAAAYSGLRLEVQVRTALQHSWATTVEAVDAFTKQALKSNQGSPRWLRFFALMSSEIARREDCDLVPGTPTSRQQLSAEIRTLSHELNVAGVLSAYQATAEYSGKADGHYYLMRLDPSKEQLAVTKYGVEQLELATKDYLEAEKRAADTPTKVVLVSAESLTDLKRAYPNYFLDLAKFIRLLRHV